MYMCTCCDTLLRCERVLVLTMATLEYRDPSHRGVLRTESS